MTDMFRDWRETVRIATDLALLGILTAIAALPVVTAGAAVATSSAAIHHHLEYDRWPAPRVCWGLFRRRIVSGLLASVGLAVAVTLVVADLLALRSGAVPGGTPAMALTVAVAVGAAGYAALRVVATGAADDNRYSEVTRPAVAPGGVRPGQVLAAAGILAVAVALAVLVHPVLTPVVAAYALFALHVVTRRRRHPAAALPAPVEPLLSPAEPVAG